ncbi:MAG: hypothetical protein ACKERG_00935 [Candidatus Hodgkinia cicadicola]
MWFRGRCQSNCELFVSKRLIGTSSKSSIDLNAIASWGRVAATANEVVRGSRSHKHSVLVAVGDARGKVDADSLKAAAKTSCKVLSDMKRQLVFDTEDGRNATGCVEKCQAGTQMLQLVY